MIIYVCFPAIQHPTQQSMSLQGGRLWPGAFGPAAVHVFRTDPARPLSYRLRRHQVVSSPGDTCCCQEVSVCFVSTSVLVQC